MYWDWNKTFGGTFRLGLMLLSFSFVIQNEEILNDAFLPQIPVGFILIVILGLFILRHIFRTLEWYSSCFKSKRYRVNVFVHFCLYLIVFSIALSTPVALASSPSMHGDALQNNGSTNLLQTIGTFTTTESTTPDISDYKTNPKTVDYNYVLHGNRGHIQYTVYGGLNDYLKGLSRSITYYNTPPTDIDFINRDLNDEYQKQLLDPLVEQIRSITSNKDDQARIAISLVQNIDYDTAGFTSGNVKGKYPYEVLYTGSGVCSEKSELLAYLLRGLGYEVVIFRFHAENHDAVGIKCAQQYSYRGTGYCFVESTSPTIITDSGGDYVGVGKLTSMPDILKICYGSSFDSVSEEYDDNMAFNRLYNKLNSYSGTTLSQSEYDEWKSYHDEWQKLVDKYGIIVEYQ
jgi:hypothetical protein